MKKLILLLIFVLSFPYIGHAAEDFYIENGTLIKYNGSAAYVEIPSEVTVIGEEAFRDNQKLRKVIIHGRVTEIQESAFENCISLSEVEGMAAIIGDSAFSGCIALKAVPQLAATEQIGENAFFGCISLENTELGENLTLLDDNAFNGCRKITHIKIPYTLEKIGTGAFMNCTGLKSVELDEYGGIGVREIGESAFMACTSLESIKTPETLINIAPYAFSGSGISRAELFCETIDEYAFADCKNLKYIFFDDKVEKIGAFAFSGCTALADMYINEEYTIADVNAFYGCGELTAKKPKNEALTEAYKFWISIK